MNGYKPMGSVAENLLRFIDTALVHDSNYEIAEILLVNYPKLKDMSITDMAELCYVSKASLSRFCKFLGYESFKEFRRYLQDEFTMRVDYSRTFYAMLCSDQELALSAYRDDLVGNIYATITPENQEVIKAVAKEIHQCGTVAYFSHHFLGDIGRYLQSKMMMMGKYIRAYAEHNHQLECAGQLGRDSLAIVCSIGGSYMTRYPEISDAIERSGCKLLIITQNLSGALINRADYILLCGCSNRNDIGKYTALMTADMIVMEYLKNYSNAFSS